MWVANEAAPKKGETRMKTNPVPNDPAGLVAFAQVMAAVLSERSEQATETTRDAVHGAASPPHEEQ